MPIIAGANLTEANIGYASAIDTANASSPDISSCAARIDGIVKAIDKPIANNQTFLLIELRMGFKD
jgi:hypothetical protein